MLDFLELFALFFIMWFFDVARVMAEEGEYRCFIGGLSWSTSDRGLKEAFEKFGHLQEAKVSDFSFSLF